MSSTPIRLGTVAFLLALALSACATAVGSDPSPSQPASPSEPADPTPEPTPSDAPGEEPTEPSEQPMPSTPAPTPVPTEEPIEIIRITMPVRARITADGVAVRVLPGLDQPLIMANGPEGQTIAGLRLSAGDPVGVAWGPVFVDGHTWYAVQHGDDDPTWGEGWVAAEFLEEVEPVGLYPLVRIDGFGHGDAITTRLTENAPLHVSAVVTPMPDEDSCEAELIVIGTDGKATTVSSVTATETLKLFGGPLENGALYQETAGDATIQMRTDCSWAAIGFVPQG